MTQIQMHKETGLAKSGLSEVLAGKKPFSKTMIGTLATYFHVPTSVLAANIGQEYGRKSRKLKSETPMPTSDDE